MKTARTLALSALAALLAGCGTTGTRQPDQASVAPAAAPPQAPPVSKETHPVKIVSLPFRVDVSYSPAAASKMQDLKAELGVSADYYGVPKDPAAEGLDPDLGVWLGGEMQTLTAGRLSVTMKGQVDAGRVAREVIGDARVRIIAFPVRDYTAQSLISCTAFEEILPIAVETGAMVHCTLAGE